MMTFSSPIHHLLTSMIRIIECIFNLTIYHLWSKQAKVCKMEINQKITPNWNRIDKIIWHLHKCSFLSFFITIRRDVFIRLIYCLRSLKSLNKINDFLKFVNYKQRKQEEMSCESVHCFSLVHQLCSSDYYYYCMKSFQKHPYSITKQTFEMLETNAFPQCDWSINRVVRRFLRN